MNASRKSKLSHPTTALAALLILALLVSSKLDNPSVVAKSPADGELQSLPSSRALPLPTFETSAQFPISFEVAAGEWPVDYVELYYNLDGIRWAKHNGKFSTSPINFDSAATGGDGRYSFYTVAKDTAGNAEPSPADADAATVVDTRPPTFLLDLSASAVGTGDSFQFGVVVNDASGISGVAAEYWQGSGPPQVKALLPTGGAYSAAIEVAANLTDTLRYRYQATDGAGHEQTTVTKTVSVFDNDRPQVRITRPAGGEVFRGGGAVTIDWSADDNLGMALDSAVISTSLDGGATWSALGSGLPNSGSMAWATPAEDSAAVVLAVAATDTSGNVGRAVVSPPLTIDSTPPTTVITSPPVVATSSFIVGWSAADNLAGVARYFVQFKVGESGTWQDWFQGGAPYTITQAVFGPTSPAPVTDGSVFYFRAQAIDRVGNEETFSENTPQSRTGVSRFKVYIPLAFGTYCPEPLNAFTNGAFERGFDGWTSGGGLPSSIVEGASAQTGKSLLLGDPGYTCTDYGPPNIPVDQSAWVKQRTTISACPFSAILTFSFRMVTFDVAWSDYHGRYVDTFEFSVRDADTGELLHLWRYGNTDNTSFGCSKQKDFGWQEHSVDLSAFRGRSIEVEFANWNRVDGYLNTYTYVDDVKFR